MKKRQRTAIIPTILDGYLLSDPLIESMAEKTAFHHFLSPFHPEIRAQVLQSACSPLFIPRYSVSQARHQELAHERRKLILGLGLVTAQDQVENPSKLMTMCETVGMLDTSSAMKISVQMNLFAGMLREVGTERHREMVRKAGSLDAIGGFALTELGHGNDLSALETTATWSPPGFTLHSPTVSSHKILVSNVYHSAQWLIVFAQLQIHGNNEGIHAFLVRIRNEDMSVVKGVRIETMGMKMEDHGNDSAKVAFDGVEIPREALLNRYSEVNERGEFRSEIERKKERVGAIMGQMTYSRLCTASTVLGACKLGALIMTRFSAQRLSTGPTGKSDTPILSYQLQQNALFPLLSKLICLNIFHNYVQREFAQRSPHMPELSILTKAMLTWHAERLLSIGRERMGGQGYLACNRIPSFLGFVHGTVTGEGDNAIIMQKVASLRLNPKNQPEVTLKYCPMRQIPQLQDVNSHELLFELIKIKEKMTVTDLQNAIKSHLKAKKSFFEIWSKLESEKIQLLARAYGERLCAEQALRALSERPDLDRLLNPVVSLYLLDLVKSDLAWYLLRGVLSTTAARGVVEGWSQAVKRVGVVVMEVIEGFGIPEEVVFAPAAKDLQHFYSSRNNGEHLPLSKL